MQDLLPPAKHSPTIPNNNSPTYPIYTKRTQSLQVWTKDDKIYHLAIDGSQIYHVESICEVEFSIHFCYLNFA